MTDIKYFEFNNVRFNNDLPSFFQSWTNVNIQVYTSQLKGQFVQQEEANRFIASNSLYRARLIVAKFIVQDNCYDIVTNLPIQ